MCLYSSDLKFFACNYNCCHLVYVVETSVACNSSSLQVLEKFIALVVTEGCSSSVPVT
jgi:hypothetical protein